MKRLNACKAGSVILKIFLITTCLFVCYYAYDLFKAPFGFSGYRESPAWFVTKLVMIFILEFILFWIGIILVYINCSQLRIKWRVLGAVFGLIPVVHLILLFIIISTADAEVKFEKAKIKLDESRKDRAICRTKYPLLMVHGIFFRDFTHLNYWGRIPEELIKNGATIFYGEHNSSASVAECAQQLADKIKEIKAQTGCEKVNVIAHSKGGLDMRYAIAKCGVADDVASLTTINTPHRGCEFAEYLLEKIPESQQKVIAKAYNAGAAKLGDINPDFMAGVTDLTHSSCMKMNEEIKDVPGIYYQSVGSFQRNPIGGQFPLNMSYLLVKHFDGKNDGLVGEKSFPWGEKFTMLEPAGRRGISHGDMIDLNRQNIKGFDVREFYVGLVSSLKEMGY